MEAAWKQHQRTTGATARLDDAVCLNYIEDLQIGEVYRDYAPLSLKPSEDAHRQTAVRKIRKALGR